MKRKICVITGSRAEYGLLYWLMKGIQDANDLQLQIIATGTHLSPEFGLTYKEIEEDGFVIDKKVEMVLSADTPSAITKSTGLGMISFAEVFADLKPDVAVVLGDRYEVFAATFAVLVACIPIAHIGGGEVTEGAFDEAIRHSITKMAFLHFTAAEEYRKRVIQLGEDSSRVFNVGGMGIDAIIKTDLLKKRDLEQRLGFNFQLKNLLVTFHPVTLEKNSSEKQFAELLAALETLNDTYIIFTAPNADTDGRIIIKMINDFVSENSDMSIAFTSMGQLNYHSTLQYVDAVVGNSSSGLSEAPSFRIGTINIGDRQKGRLKVDCVIDCEPEKESILNAIGKVYSREYQEKLSQVKNPFGDGHASEKILDVLRTIGLPGDPKKVFHDL
jgi:GDP/UDP-N,N'-diacetylbacillosamine 2-epimerase (hydrolysing)